jgi:hypothetical protein
MVAAARGSRMASANPGNTALAMLSCATSCLGFTRLLSTGAARSLARIHRQRPNIVWLPHHGAFQILPSGVTVMRFLLLRRATHV